MWNAHLYVAERIQSNVQMYLAKRIDACSGMYLCMWSNALMSAAECIYVAECYVLRKALTVCMLRNALMYSK
jgi:hypothetical protein